MIEQGIVKIEASENKSQQPDPAERVESVFRLYIADETFSSVQAINNFKSICAQYVPEPYQLEIVDILQQPLRALSDGILVTPTLVRLLPLPVRTIIGDLNDKTPVLHLLGLKGVTLNGMS